MARFYNRGDFMTIEDYRTITPPFNLHNWADGELISEQKMDNLDFKALSGGNSILIQNNEPGTEDVSEDT